MNEPNLKCSYAAGPCVGMDNHSHDSWSTKRAGIFALDNRVVLSDPSMRTFHAGFTLKGSPDARVPKAGVMLNFCPWCGADLMEWLAAYRTAIDAHKLALSHEASERSAT